MKQTKQTSISNILPQTKRLQNANQSVLAYDDQDDPLIIANSKSTSALTGKMNPAGAHHNHLPGFKVQASSVNNASGYG
jgi:hypothetical protein